jgi:hypothetical protein
MQGIDLKISISDATLGLIDAIRLARSREEVIRQLIELGLCELLEVTARTHRESTMHSTLGLTRDLAIARNNLIAVKAWEDATAQNEPGVDEPPNGQARRYETMHSITQRNTRG